MKICNTPYVTSSLGSDQAPVLVSADAGVSQVVVSNGDELASSV